MCRSSAFGLFRNSSPSCCDTRSGKISSSPASRCLRRTVGRHHGQRDEAGHRAEIEDGAAAVARQNRCEGLRHRKQTQHIHLELAAGGRQPAWVGQGAVELGCHSGVVEEELHIGRRSRRGTHVLGTCDIELERHDTPARRADDVGQRLRSSGRCVDLRCPPGDERLDQGATNSAVGARDERRCSCNAKRHLDPFSRKTGPKPRH